MKKDRLVKRTISIEQEMLDRLNALSARTRVPQSEYIREGIERVTQLALIQMKTLEKAGAKFG